MERINEIVNAPVKEVSVAAAGTPSEVQALGVQGKTGLPYTYDETAKGEMSSGDLYSNPADNNSAPFDKRYDKKQIEEEHIRYLSEVKKLDKMKEKNSSGRNYDLGIHGDFKDKSRIKTMAESGADLVAARMKYDVGTGTNELAIELLKFGEHTTSQKREYKEEKKRIKDLKKSIKKAKKLERKATVRYYTVLYKESESPSVLKKAKRQERLAMVVAKLEGLLKERENLDSRLATLYKGAESRSGGKIRIKAERKRYKKAKKVQRSLRSAHCRFSKMNIPESLKVKIRYLFNTKIVSKSTIAYSKYLLKKLKPKGDARAELKRNIKKAEKSLALLEISLKKLTKKARKLNEKRVTRRRFFKTFLFLVIVAAVAAVVIMKFLN